MEIDSKSSHLGIVKSRSLQAPGSFAWLHKFPIQFVGKKNFYIKKAKIGHNTAHARNYKNVLYCAAWVLYFSFDTC